MSELSMTPQTAAATPTPAGSKKNLFMDSATGYLRQKDSAGVDSTAVPPASGGGGPALSNYFYANDTQASGTNGGASVSGLNTRVLNTVVTNNVTGASLTSNKVTLPAGTYWISANAPAGALRAKLVVYNVTDAAIAINGRVEYENAGTPIRCNAEGYVVIAASKVFELRHYVQAALGSYGLGIGNAGVIGLAVGETYAEFRAWKIA